MKILEEKLKPADGEEQIWQVGISKVFMKEEG